MIETIGLFITIISLWLAIWWRVRQISASLVWVVKTRNTTIPSLYEDVAQVDPPQKARVWRSCRPWCPSTDQLLNKRPRGEKKIVVLRGGCGVTALSIFPKGLMEPILALPPSHMCVDAPRSRSTQRHHFPGAAVKLFRCLAGRQDLQAIPDQCSRGGEWHHNRSDMSCSGEIPVVQISLVYAQAWFTSSGQEGQHLRYLLL